MKHKTRLPAWVRLLLLSHALPWLIASAAAGETLRVQGSTTVNPVVTEALEILAKTEGLTYRIDTLGGSSGGITAAARGQADVGMTSRRVSAEDRARFPDAELRETTIGIDAVALVVSADVWQSGVHSVSAEQMRGIYERRLRTWKELQGPDQRIVFFNKEPGRGTWSVFADWLYGSAQKAPPVSHPEVGANSEVRTKVSRTPGAVSQLSFTWVDQETVFALGIRNADGRVSHPTAPSIAAGEYPLSRPLILVTVSEPTGASLALIEFLLGPDGQKLVREHGFLPLADMTP